MMVSCSSRTRHALCGYVAGAGTCALVASLWYARQRLKRFGESRSPKEAVEEACYVPAAISRYRREAAVAVELARECGRAMLAAASSAKSVEWKGAGILDPCTATDRDNETAVCHRLAREFPDHAVIGEEAAAAAGCVPAADPRIPTWIVDPVDGTQNFFHDLPLACVSIGLSFGGKPVLGVVYDPYRDETYVAVDGCGAFVNGERLAAAGAGQLHEPRTLSESLVLTDPGYERSPRGVARLAKLHERLLSARTRAIRIVGSSVLAVLLVAGGRASAFVVGVGDGGDSPKPWDFCAASVFAAETGCVLEALDGRVHPPAPPSPPPRDAGGAFDVRAMSCVCARTRGLADEVKKIVAAL